MNLNVFNTDSNSYLEISKRHFINLNVLNFAICYYTKFYMNLYNLYGKKNQYGIIDNQKTEWVFGSLD